MKTCLSGWSPCWARDGRTWRVGAGAAEDEAELRFDQAQREELADEPSRALRPVCRRRPPLCL
ncbi:MAG: hypothetical protein ACLR93_11530 [Alistipes onderdonkii]